MDKSNKKTIEALLVMIELSSNKDKIKTYQKEIERLGGKKMAEGGGVDDEDDDEKDEDPDSEEGLIEIEERWKKKKEHLEKVASSITSLRNNLTRDLKSEDEKERVTASVISVCDKTAERVGNQDSEEDGHFGVTGFQKRHITIDGNTVSLKYKGKSGVDHEKSFSDAGLAEVLKEIIKNSPTKFVFTTSDGFRIKSDRVNRYLEPYEITIKDIRGFHANNHIKNRLEKEEIDPEEKKRKTAFNKAVRYAAEKVGHGTTTLKNHYLMPELAQEYIINAKIIDLKTFYSEGGDVK